MHAIEEVDSDKTRDGQPLSSLEELTVERLTPAQRKVCDQLLAGIGIAGVCVLRGDAGSGKSTILRTLQGILGAGRLEVRDFMVALMRREPAALEEAFLDLFDRTLSAHDVVLADDLHLVTNVVDAFEYPRAQLLMQF